MLYKYVKKVSNPTPLTPQAVAHYAYKKTPLLIASMCFITGILLIAYTAYPYLTAYIENAQGGPITKSLLAPSVKLTNLTQDYYTNVTKNFAKTNELLDITPKTHPEYADIKGTMYLSILKLGIVHLPIQINVNSYDEKQYMSLLNTSLAHFLGTSLPDKGGNTFVYGHSAEELAARIDRNNPSKAFTFLKDMNIGDEIKIEYNSKIFNYAVQKLYFVNADDLSPIYSTSNEKVLTLMTCHPPGIGVQRLILSASQV